ncbi:DUF2977 domain-containing protein [Pediococcus acidilactici]|uniref:DUF2977 domain-containing protein n=1 Tax=Pediococcus acidilactici TaxID=1254 RepID=UPI003562C968
MRLRINDKDEIIAYATLGDINDSTEYAGTVPDDFYDKFKPSFYLLQNNEIIENPNYVAPEPPVIGLSEQDKLNAQIMLNQAKQKAEQDKFNAQILLKLAGGTK